MALASAQAFYYGAPTYGIVSPLTYGPYGVVSGNAQCFPQQCQACKDSFAGEPSATFNCLGKCGLCDLCKGRAPGQVADCERWCQVGQQECVNNCEAGKAVCVGCTGTCAAQGIAFA